MPTAVKDLARCLTFSALCLIPLFVRFGIVSQTKLNYYRSGPYSLYLPALAFAAVAALGILFYAVQFALRRLGSPAVRRIVLAAAPLLLVPTVQALPATSGLRALGFGAIAACTVLLLLKPSVLTFFGGALLVLSPLIPIQVASALWHYQRQPAARDFRNVTRSSGAPAAKARGRRIVWMIFDELDEQLAFELRPQNVQLPALDQLRREAVYVADARPAAPDTLIAIPSLFLGRPVTRAEPVDFETLHINDGNGRTVSWGRERNVFADAAAFGYRSALAGWFHPYCRTSGNTLNYCESYASADASPALARESGLRHFGLLSAALMAAERASNNTGLGRLFNAGGGNASDRELDFFRIERAKIYEHIYTASQRLAADPQFDFVVLHWPVPHPPGIYDRTRNRKQWTKKSNYFDNLELVDYTIGQVRQTMVEAKVWESTTLVLTADHPLRPNLYAKHSYWTQEEETLARLRKAERVPFLVKLAGQRSGIEYQGNFDTLRTRALLTAMMQGSVSSAEQVIEWLGRQQSANLAERRQ